MGKKPRGMRFRLTHVEPDKETREEVFFRDSVEQAIAYARQGVRILSEQKGSAAPSLVPGEILTLELEGGRRRILENHPDD